MSLDLHTPLQRPTRMLQVRDPLVDALGRRITHLRMVVSERCPLACRACRPHAGSGLRAAARPLGRREAIRILQAFTTLGVRTVSLGGGDPLLRRDLEPLVAGLSPEVEGRVHLATHGMALARRARGLRDAGLASVGIRLDAATPEGFARIHGRAGLGRVLAGAEAARRAGLQVHLTAMVLRGWNEDQVVPLARLALTEHLELRLLECMPLGHPGWDPGAFMAATAIVQQLQEGLGDGLEEGAPLSLEEGPARSFRLCGGQGRLAVVSNLDAELCPSCTRMQISPDGTLKTCQFSQTPVDLLGPLQRLGTHGWLVQRIRESLEGPLACHPLRTREPWTAGTGWSVGG